MLALTPGGVLTSQELGSRMGLPGALWFVRIALVRYQHNAESTEMEEQRTRNFAESGTGIIDIDGLRLHARWRMSGTQQYVAGAGASTDGRRNDISLAVYFDRLPDETAVVEDLLRRITAQPSRPLAVDLGRTGHPGLYCLEMKNDQSGNPSSLTLTDQPVSE